MNDISSGSDALPTALSTKPRWPGLVWAIPIAALLVVLYLGINALVNRGVKVVVIFDAAEGVTPGDTKVLVKGVEAGHVVGVRLATGGRQAEVTLRLDKRAEPALRTDAQFWLIGEKPTLTDFNSVRAAVAGVTIGASPGRYGSPAHRFIGLEQPPVVESDIPGTAYLLTATDIGSIQRGSAVNYRGREIGKVINTPLISPGVFRIQIFIKAPYDRFVQSGSQFWKDSPLKLSLSGSSVSAQVSSPASLLQGAIQFELPDGGRAGPHSPANSSFILYSDEAAAAIGPSGPEVPYEVVLPGSPSNLASDAKITLLGYIVGRVKSSELRFATGSHRPYTAALVALFPRQLGVAANRNNLSEGREATDRAVTALAARGFRAHLVQSPPLVGSRSIELAADTPASPAMLVPGTAYPMLPVSAAADPISEVTQIAAKLNRVPILEIGSNLRAATANLGRITGAPQVLDSISHLDGTLRQLDLLMAEFRPRVGPLMTKLDQTASDVGRTAAAARALVSGDGVGQDQGLPDAIRQLDETARSIRSLTDYLGRHPEALIRGKAKPKAKEKQ